MSEIPASDQRCIDEECDFCSWTEALAMRDKERDDSPSVIGGLPSDMPTQDEFRAAHRREYVRLFVDIGVPQETAEGWHDDQWEDLKDNTPQECFDNEVSYWENDGD